MKKLLRVQKIEKFRVWSRLGKLCLLGAIPTCMLLKEIFGNNFNKRRLTGGLSSKSFVSSVLVRIFSVFFMKVLSWNLCGLGRAEKLRAVGRLIDTHNIDVCFLLETKN